MSTISEPVRSNGLGPAAVRRLRRDRLRGLRREQRLGPDDVVVVDKPMLHRAVGAAAVGNAMEWFDFGVFGYLLLTLSDVFFPAGNPTLNKQMTFALLAIAFLVRPLGGLVLGPLGDRVGRTRVLAITMLLMAGATFATGLLPSYAQVGVLAPLLLLGCRLIQGFSTGGEYGGATTFMSEYAPDRRRGFYGSFLDFGTFIGYAAGATVVTVLEATLSDAAMHSWGWRVPFLVAGPIGLIGLYIRSRLEDTPAFDNQTEPRRQSGNRGEAVGHWFSMMRANLGPMLVCGGLVILYNVPNYLFTSFLPTFLQSPLGISADLANLMVLICMLTVVACIIPVGSLSDRIGRRATFLIGALLAIIGGFPAFWLIFHGGTVGGFVACVLFGLMLAFFAGPTASTLPALFPTAVRYSALAISFNVFVSLFGGTTPFIANDLVTHVGVWAPAIYLVAAGVVGIVAVAFLRESATQPLRGSAVLATDEDEAESLTRAA